MRGVRSVAVVAIALEVISLLVLRFTPPAAWGMDTLRDLLDVIICFGAIATTWGPGILIADYLPKPFSSFVARPAAIVVAGAAVGWLVFLAWFIHPGLGWIISALVILTGIVGIGRRPASLIRDGLAYPLVTTLVICLLYFCLAGDHGDFAQGAMGIAHRYWVSVDNKIPQIFADALLVGGQYLADAHIGDWHLGDRPPLETGILMPFYWAATPETRDIAYIALGIAVNSTWVLALWSFLRAVGLPERRIAISVITVAACGAIYFNTVYAWPKLIGGALVLAVAVFFLLRAPSPLTWVLAGVGSALAMLAHGTSAFGLLGLVPIALGKPTKGGMIRAAVGLAALVLTYLPWVGYQTFFDPSGARLVKWHLAGVPEPDDPRSSLRAIAEQYEAAGIGGTIQNKITNVWAIVGTKQFLLSPGWENVLGRIRNRQIVAVVPAAGILLIGIAALAFGWARQHEPWVRPTFLIIGASTVAFVLLEFGYPGAATATLVVAPYSLLLLWCAAGAVVLSGVDALWGRLVLAAHFLFFYIVWMVTFTAKSAVGFATDYPLEGGLVVGAALCSIVLVLLVGNGPPGPVHAGAAISREA